MFNAPNQWGYSWRNAKGELGHLGDRKPYVRPLSPFGTVVCAYVGCGREIARNLLQEHTAQCGYCPAQCDWCESVITVRDMKNHRKRCGKRPTLCPNGCLGRTGNVIILAYESIASHRQFCWEEMVNCKHPGCFERRKRRDIGQHEEEDHRYCLLDSIHKSPEKRTTRLLMLQQHEDWDRTMETDKYGGPVFYSHSPVAGSRRQQLITAGGREQVDYVATLKEEFSHPGGAEPTENNGRLFRYTRPPPRPLNVPDDSWDG